MGHTKMKCDEAALKSLVSEDCNGEQNDAIFEHVENCETCQQRLASFAAEAEMWGRANRAFNTRAQSTGHDDSSCNLVAHRFRVAADASPQWTDAMARQLLSPPTHPEMLGRLGRYEVERLLGAGGMGIVFKAFDTELNRPVAIKLLAPYLARSQSARDRFAREARAAAGIVDDHVVPIHNVDSEAESPFLVMQYIAGGSLQDRLNRDGALDVCEILRIGMQTARGLAAAHSQGLIHRDVKPSNVLLDEDVSRAMLTDFGLARTDDEEQLTQTGFHPGTPQYMAPEQVRGEEIDGRSDLFSLGCLMHALCTGKPPFRGNGSFATLRLVTDAEAPSIRIERPELPDWLDRIVSRLLEKQATDRFQSAAEVASLLESCLAHVRHPSTSSLPAEVQTKLRESTRIPRKRWLIATGFIPLLLLLATITIIIETKGGKVTIEVDDSSGKVIQVADDIKPPSKVESENESLLVPTAAQLKRSVAVLYLIHANGVQKGTSIQQHAVTRAIGELRDHDYCGYLACIDGKTQWLWGGDHGISRARDKDKVRLFDLIKTATTGDLPSMDIALKMALDSFGRIYAAQRRLIVLTDGSPALRNAEILDQYKQAGIQIDVVHTDIHESKYRKSSQLISSRTDGEYVRLAGAELAQAIPQALAERTRACIASLANEADSQATWDSLKEIGIGFHNFNAQYQKFPGSKNVREGSEPYSWRVAILPYVGEGKLFRQYRFHEPWDSDWNSKLVAKMPAIYAPRRKSTTPHGETHLMGLATPDGALGTGYGEAPDSFRDGLAKTILIVEAGQSVPWTKPEDLSSALKPFQDDVLHFVMANGRVDKMDPIDRKQLKKMLSKNDESVGNVEERGAENKSSALEVPILRTWNEVELHVKTLIERRKQLSNSIVQMNVRSEGENFSQRYYKVWANGHQRRSDCRGNSDDGSCDYSQILTPSVDRYQDHQDPSRSQLNRRAANAEVGWGTLGCVPDVRKIGLVNWPVESVDTIEFDEHLLPTQRSNIRVKIGEHDSHPITIVKMDRKVDGLQNAWTEYWLSPAHGNYPIYISSGFTDDKDGGKQYRTFQHCQWKEFDGVWFPTHVAHHHESATRVDIHTMELIDASFNLNSFPNVFDADEDNVPPTDESKKLEIVQRDINLLWRALDQYSDDHEGNSPKSLDDLVPDYLRELPLDPFSTKATADAQVNKYFRTSAGGYGYRYRQGVGRSWIISSAGPTDGSYTAELDDSLPGDRARLSFYRSKGTWISGRQPTGHETTTASAKSGASDLAESKLLSLRELSKIVGDKSVFYQGSVDEFHFVRVPDVGFFRLRREDVTIPQHGLQGDGSGKLGMIWRTLRIEAGKLVAPDVPTGSF